MSHSKITKDNILDIINKATFKIQKSYDGTIHLINKNKINTFDKLTVPQHVNPKLIVNQILHMEMRVVRKNIDKWIDEIERYFFMEYIEDIEKFAVAMNQFSLILTYGNLKKEAMDFCQKLIFTYHRIDEKIKTKPYIIQPYINLIRLYRIQHEYIKMEEGMSIFNGSTDKSKIGNIVLDAIECIKKSDELKLKYACLINSVITVESIKALLDKNDFHNIIQYVAKEIEITIKDQNELIDFNKSYKAEALIIAYHHTGKLEEAYKICTFFIEHGLISEMHVFYYRITELYLSLGWKQQFKQETDKLYKYVVQCLEKNPPVLSEILFSFHISNILDSKAKKEFILKRTVYCFKKINEEVGTIESLKKLVNELNIRKYNPEYLSYLKNSGYAYLRKDKKIPIHIYEKLNKLISVFDSNYLRFNL